MAIASTTTWLPREPQQPGTRLARRAVLERARVETTALRIVKAVRHVEADQPGDPVLRETL